MNTPVDIITLVSVVFSINFIRFVLLTETLFIGINAKEKSQFTKKKLTNTFTALRKAEMGIKNKRAGRISNTEPPVWALYVHIIQDANAPLYMKQQHLYSGSYWSLCRLAFRNIAFCETGRFETLSAETVDFYNGAFRET